MQIGNKNQLPNRLNNNFQQGKKKFTQADEIVNDQERCVRREWKWRKRRRKVRPILEFQFFFCYLFKI